MSAAVTEAELGLARALMKVSQVRDTPEEAAARVQVKRAEERLARAKAMPVGKDERLCCDVPMLFSDNRWICATGKHDD